MSTRAGSFVTLRAASDLGRNGVGYEINQRILSEAMDSFPKGGAGHE